MSRLRSGFTLLEMMAVVLLTSLVLGAALGHYVTLSRVTERASKHTREVRRAAAILDRMARDLESSFIVMTRDEQDPLENGFFFYGESLRSELGADELKFVRRSPGLRRTAAHESDVETVGYVLRESELGDWELLRWASPRAPERYDARIPVDPSEGAHVLASGLAEFGVRFIDEAGEVSKRWDSSQLERSGELPLAVEIELALSADADEGRDPERYRRRVLLPVRPLDFEELLNPASRVSGGTGSDADTEDEIGEEGEEDGDLLARCQASPCGKRSACDVIDCQGNLGLISPSIDTALNRELVQPRSFCHFMASYGLKHTLLDRLGVPGECRLQ